MAELYLVEFKGSRKGFFYNAYYHNLNAGNHVIVQAERGEDVGLIVKRVEVEVDFSQRERPRTILRPASADDQARLSEIRRKEDDYRTEVIDLIAEHGLSMKVVDVECQFDGNKMTVFFTAGRRVDFRELVKNLAARYRTRIELRQIGVRDEARRLGGYGICGRQQCCSSFITDFAPISTQHARDQDLPLNPAKISGNCGRLLCCLRFEADLYTTCRRMFPEVGSFVKTKVGDGVLERIDVFNEEAVVRGQENQLFRCSAKSIQVVERRHGRHRDRQDRAAGGNAAIEDKANGANMEKLADSDNTQ